MVDKGFRCVIGMDTEELRARLEPLLSEGKLVAWLLRKQDDSGFEYVWSDASLMGERDEDMD